MLASGSGSNLQVLIDNPKVRPQIAIVASDVADAPALARARAVGIPTAVVEWDDFPGRESFSTALADRVEAAGAKGVALAGFMRILSPSFVDRFPNRILNVHPSLLPAFPGAHAVRAALEHGVKVTGVTVHLVDHLVDHGPIVAQAAVAIEPGDTTESLHRRIQQEEHRLYPRVVEMLISGELEMLADGGLA